MFPVFAPVFGSKPPAQQDEAAAPGAPAELIVRETARHFSGRTAAALQIVPPRPKLMEGQFGGSEGLSGRGPRVTIILWFWIYFLTSVPDVLPSALHLRPLPASISPPSVADNNEKAPALNSHQLEPGDYKVPPVFFVFFPPLAKLARGFSFFPRLRYRVISIRAAPKNTIVFFFSAHLSILSDVIGRKVYSGDRRRRRSQVSKPREAEAILGAFFFGFFSSSAPTLHM